MTLRCVAVLYVLLAIGEKASAIPLSMFYDYGLEFGDQSTPRVDDGGSPRIILNFTFPFFGSSHSTVYVSICTLLMVYNIMYADQ